MERRDLIEEISNQHKKLSLITKKFGAYINIVDIDDTHFEDQFLSRRFKERLQVTHKEEALSNKYNIILAKMGFRDTKWGRVSIIMFAIWTLFTCFICFEKADFLNLTLGVMGLYQMLDPQNIRLSYIRLITFALPYTMLYDVIWIF